MSSLFFLDAKRNRVELEILPTRLDRTAGELRFLVDCEASHAERASTLLGQAAADLFHVFDRAGVAVRPDRPRESILPVTLRDPMTGALRVAYREVTVRFAAKVSKRKRRQILSQFGFEQVGSSFAQDREVLAIDPGGRHVGVHLFEIANKWAMMEEVEFSVPNLATEFHREGSSGGGANRNRQWNLLAVSARDAWQVSRGMPSVCVAIVDDGIDIKHPRLLRQIRQSPDPKEKRDRFGRDFYIRERDHAEHFNPVPKIFKYPFNRLDGNDIHGTPCAGLVAADGVSAGASGIAPECSLLPVKVFHGDFLCRESDVADAIRYAAMHSDIVSCSWTCPYSTDIAYAIEDASINGRNGVGAALFAASGNDDQDRVSFPANTMPAIAVGASTDKGRRARYSNRGAEVSIVAPSGGGTQSIFTTDVSYPNRGFNDKPSVEAGGADGLHTSEFGGTSAATPLAAGIAALMLSVNPGLDPPAIREILELTASKIGDGYDKKTGHSTEFGHGQVDAAKAIARAMKP